MKAAVYREYGSPAVIRIEDVEKPTPKDHQILVRVRASTVGTWDCEARSFSFPLWFWLPLRMAMGIRKPRWPVLGQELAGEVEAVGRDVGRFKEGDQVFAYTGLGFGAYAEYICLPENCTIVTKPAGMSHEEAAAVPLGGMNALHYLREAEIREGERVLVNGAAGSFGTFAVQLAKLMGAQVTAVDRTEKLDMLRELGAGRIIDFTREDFTESDETYDVIFNVVARSSYSKNLRSLGKGGRYLLTNPAGMFQMFRAAYFRSSCNSVQ